MLTNNLEEALWSASDKMRGQIDSMAYKHIILGLIFLKYISDGLLPEHQQLDIWAIPATNNLHKETPTTNKTNNFIIPTTAKWSFLKSYRKQPIIGKMIDEAMIAIELENPVLKNSLPKDYSSIDARRLEELINLLDIIEIKNIANNSPDILGRVYEYFLGRFASLEGKGGEFYTPQSVVNLLIEMLQPDRGIIYDPCCGSGGLFVQSEKFAQTQGNGNQDLVIYGQESNLTTWRLCKLNLAVRGISAHLGEQNADTLHQDLHKDLKADFVVANPPFNMSDWGVNKLGLDPRWQYGIPPANNANFAWVQHIIHHLKPDGLAGFVLSNGSLNNGQTEGEIRGNLIENDLIDCVIALPNQLFYTTQIATSLWFITKNKAGNKLSRPRQGETLFIYAYEMGEMIDRTHRVLTDQEITKIANTYKYWRTNQEFSSYQDIPGFCKSANLAEIKSHKMSLVPGRYVGFAPHLTKHENIDKLQTELNEIQTRLTDIAKASESAYTILKELLYG